MTNDGITHSARTPLEWAQSMLGVKEATGNNDGPAIDVFTGGRQEPWCAHFVAWCFRMAGNTLPGDVVPTPKRANPIASVTMMHKRFEQATGMLTHKLTEPEPGDIIFFRSRVASDPGRGRHVGIVERYDDDTETVHTIEGNTGNGVRRRAYHVDDARISTYGRGWK